MKTLMALDEGRMSTPKGNKKGTDLGLSEKYYFHQLCKNTINKS